MNPIMSRFNLKIKNNRDFFSISVFFAVFLIISSQIFLPLNAMACSYQQQCLDLSIQKTVRNVTAGQQNYTDSTNANNGDQVQFQIQIQNTGNTTLQNVIIRDVLPPGLVYQTNSTLVDGANVSDGIMGSGINIGSLTANSIRTINFRASVNSSSLPGGNQTLFNTGYARADQVGEKSDTATIIICVIQNIYDLSINKTVRDITAGQTGYIDSVAAQNNDRVMFKIEVANTGNVALSNVIVRDTLPSQFSFANGTVRIDGVVSADSLISGVINTGSLGTGSSHIITFEAVINTGNFSGTQTIINTAFARADQVSEKNDTASAVVTNVPANLNLNISKAVRNETNGGNFSDNINAKSNDQIMFQIQITNTGNATLNNVFVRDVLPSQLSFVSGSVRVDGTANSDSFVNGGINTGSLSTGVSRLITFETIVNSNLNQTLINYAYAKADQVNEKSDSATVFVSSVLNNLALTISKTVRNETSGQGYSDSINAKNGDQIQFQLQIQNTGNATLNNIIVRDVLPSFVSYNSGSTRNDGYFISDGITSGGINVGSLAVGSTKTVTFESTINFYGFSGSQNLTNYAYARADQVSERSDSANIYISQQSYSTGNLSLTKYVRNLTKGETGLLVSTTANQNDTVLFSIQVSTQNNSQQVNNVKIWDNLPNGLNLVSGTTRLDNGLISDSLFVGGSGINIGSIIGNQTRTITFQATVGNGVNNQTLINYAYATADNVPQQTAFAQVAVGQAGTFFGGATLTKKVANISAPNGNDTNNSAIVSNTLQYTIALTNNGSGVLNNIQIADVLPPYTTFQSADSGGSYNSSSNQINWSNGNLTNGTSMSFTYRVTVNAVPYNGYVIINTASANADNLTSINSNEVRTTVGKVSAPVKAVTGSDNLTRNIAVAGMVSLWSIFFLYLIMEYGNFWKGARLKWAILKLRLKNKLY